MVRLCIQRNPLPLGRGGCQIDNDVEKKSEEINDILRKNHFLISDFPHDMGVMAKYYIEIPEGSLVYIQETSSWRPYIKDPISGSYQVATTTKSRCGKSGGGSAQGLDLSNDKWLSNDKDTGFKVVKAMVLIGASSTDKISLFLNPELTSPFPDLKNIDKPSLGLEVAANHGLHWIYENFPYAEVEVCDVKSDNPSWKKVNMQEYSRVFRRGQGNKT